MEPGYNLGGLIPDNVFLTMATYNRRAKLKLVHSKAIQLTDYKTTVKHLLSTYDRIFGR